MIGTSSDDRSDDTCPECGGRIVNRQADERRCHECGLVLDTHSLRRPQYRRAARTSGPRRRGRHLSTFMGSCARDSRGRQIGQQKQRRLRRQRRLQRRAASDAVDDSLRVGTAEIERLGASLHLGDRTETIARTIYRRAVDERLLYGRSCESVAAASVYVGVRRSGVHRELSEIAAESLESQRRIARDARHLQRKLGLGVEPPAVVEYLPRIRSTLGLSDRAGRGARRLLEAAIEANVHSGRDPRGLAASALYTVTLLDDSSPGVSQRAAAGAADVCPETVRDRYRELRGIYSDVFDVDDPTPPHPAHDPTRSQIGSTSTVPSES
jgi:transcription initiation factor TFIIB